MNYPSLIINILIFIATAVIDVRLFYHEGKWDTARWRDLFRYFTVQSNTLCAAAALLMTVSILCGRVPEWVLLIKYLGTMTVTVTLLTVLFYLAPMMGGLSGLKELLKEENLYMHLLGPLLAIISFCFFEKTKHAFGYYLLGLLPVILYGVVYFYKVLTAPEGRKWEDFYGFNRGGHWKRSFLMMLAGCILICIMLYFLGGRR